MRISDVLRSKGATVATITPETSVAGLLTELSVHNIGAMVVVSPDGPLGIVSERDVVRAMADGPDTFARSVASIMTTTVYSAPPDAHVDELMHLMTDKRVRHIPVTDPDGALLGIVSIGDVVKSRLDELESERSALLDYITQA